MNVQSMLNHSPSGAFTAPHPNPAQAFQHISPSHSTPGSSDFDLDYVHDGNFGNILPAHTGFSTPPSSGSAPTAQGQDKGDMSIPNLVDSLMSLFNLTQDQHSELTVFTQVSPVSLLLLACISSRDVTLTA